MMRYLNIKSGLLMKIGRVTLVFIFFSTQGIIFPSSGLAVTPDDVSGNLNSAGQNNASVPAGQNTGTTPRQGTSGNGANTSNTTTGFLQNQDNPLSPPDANAPRTNVALSSLTPPATTISTTTTLANPMLPPPDKDHGGVDVNILDWFGAMDGDRYEIFRREFGQTDDASWGPAIASISGDTARFIDADKISKDKAYQYKVVAYRAGQLVDPNVYLKQSVNYDLPDQGLQPQNVLVLLNKNPNVDNVLEWVPQTGADYYQVFRREQGTAQWSSVDFVSGTELKYTDKAIPKDKKYEYKVLAYKGSQSLNAGNSLVLKQSVDSGLGLVNLASPAAGLKTLTEQDLLALLKLPKRDLAVYTEYGIEITGQGDIMVPVGVYYAIRRGIPKENMVVLTDIPTEERWEAGMVTGVYDSKQSSSEGNPWPWNFPETPGVLDKSKSVLSIAQGGSWGDQYRVVTSGDNDLSKTYSLAGGGSTQLTSTVFQLEDGTQVDFKTFQGLWANQWNKSGNPLQKNPFAKVDSVTVVQDGRLVEVAAKVTLYNKPMLDFQNKVINPVAQQMKDRGIASRILSVVSAYHFPISLPHPKYPQINGNGVSWEGMLSKALSEKFGMTHYQYDGGRHFSRILGDGGFLTTRLDGADAQVAKRIIDDSIWAEQHPELFNDPAESRRAYIDWQANKGWDGNYLFLQAANRLGESGFFGKNWTPLDLSKINDQNADTIRFGSKGDPFVLAPDIRHEMDDIFFYTGWYGTSHNFSNLDRATPFHMARGAVAYHLESFSAETFRTLQGDEYAAGFLSKGAAAVMGAVYEPSVTGILHPSELTYYLMKGYSLGEAVYYADPRNNGYGPYNAIDADPLYRPFPASARPNPEVSVQKLTDSSRGTQVEAGERHIAAETAWGQPTYRDYDKAGNLIREVFPDGRTYVHLKNGSTVIMQNIGSLVNFSRTQLANLTPQATGNPYLSLSLYDPSGKRLDRRVLPFDPKMQFNYSYVPGTQRLASASYQDGTGTWSAWTTQGTNGGLDLHYKKAGTEFVLEGMDSETPVEVLFFMASSMPSYVEQMQNYRAALVNAIMIREPSLSKADIESQIPDSWAEASNIPGQLLYEFTRQKSKTGGAKISLKNVIPKSKNASTETYSFKPFVYDKNKDPEFLTYYQGFETTSPEGTRLIFDSGGGGIPSRLIYEIRANSLPKQYLYVTNEAQAPFQYAEISPDRSMKYYTLAGQSVAPFIYVGYQDKGVKTLEEAVQMAHSGDVIQIAAGTYQPTEALNLSGKNLDIRGDGEVVFDGSRESSIFASIGRNTNITFSNATFRNFLMHGEHGLYTNGAVFQITGGTLNLKNTVFENNTADSGGAISASEDAHLFIINSRFKGNKAVAGGVIYAISGSEVELVNAVFENNEGGNYGGGVIYASNIKLDVRNSLFVNNRASTGAVIQLTGSSAADLMNVTLTQNIVQGSDVAGVINLARAESRLNMSKSIIFGNQGMDISAQVSGAVVSVTQSFLQGTTYSGAGNKTGDPKLTADYTAAADSTARSAGDVWSWGYNKPVGTIVTTPTPNAPKTPPTPVKADEVTPAPRPADTTKPTGSITVKEGANQGEVVLVFDGQDRQSGVTEMVGSWDGKEWGKDPVAYVSQFTVRAPWSMTGEHQFFVKYKDAAGNWSDPIASNKFTFTPVVDNVKPTGTMNIALGNQPGQVILNFSAKDDKTQTEFLEMRGSFDGGKTWGNPPVKFMKQYVVPKAPWTVEGDYTFKVQYRDWAGNWSDPIESNSIHFVPPPVSNQSPSQANSPTDLALAVNIIIEKDPVTNTIKSIQVGQNGDFLTADEILNNFDTNHDSKVTVEEFESRRNTFNWSAYRSTPVKIQLSNGATQTQAEDMLNYMDQGKKYLASLNIKFAPPASIFLGDGSHGNYSGPDGWHLSADPAQLKEAVIGKTIQSSLLAQYPQLGYTALEAFSRYFFYQMLGYDASRIQGKFIYQASLEGFTGNDIYNAYQNPGLSKEDRDRVIRNVANNNMTLTQTFLELRQRVQMPGSFDNVVLKTLDLLKSKINPAGPEILTALLNSGIPAAGQQTVLSIFQQHGITFVSVASASGNHLI